MRGDAGQTLKRVGICQKTSKRALGDADDQRNRFTPYRAYRMLL